MLWRAESAALVTSAAVRARWYKSPRALGLAAARGGVVLLWIAGGLLKAEDAGAPPLSAEAIMRRSHMVDKVTGSRSRALVTQSDEHGWQRVRELIAITKLQANGVDNQRLLHFNPPVDVQGMVMLLLERSGADDMWMYLASDGKVRRLHESNKRDAFAGTDFSLGDLIGYAVDEWRHRIVGEENIGAESCYIIESVPATGSTRRNAGYSKRKSWISKSRFTLLKFEAWDTEGQLLKQVEFGDFQLVDSEHDKWVAMRAHARNVQSGHTTEILFFDYHIDESISDALFTPTVLESRRWMLFSF